MTEQLDPSKKEILFLWYEFLRRGRDNREIFEWIKDGAEYDRLPDKFKKDPEKMPTRDEALEEYPWGHAFFFGNSSKRKLVSPKVYFCLASGDVHSLSFEKWYKNIEKIQQRRRKKEPIKFLKDTIESHLDFMIPILTIRSGGKRKPTAKELGKSLKEEIFIPYSTLFLEIDVVGSSREELNRSFSKIINKAKGGFQVKEKEDKYRWFSHPIGRKKIDEIKRYLTVYDIWEENNSKGKWTELVSQKIDFYKDAKTGPMDLKREIQRDKSKALKIIKNAEKGIFPGNY